MDVFYHFVSKIIDAITIASRPQPTRCYFAALRVTIAQKIYLGNFYSKIVVPFGAIPLNQLQSLRDRNPRGITFGYATRDHCFVIASVGVKKEPFGSFFTPTQ
jgi:hypothetical protein